MRTKILETLANSLPVQQLLKSETITQTLGSILNLRSSVEDFIEQKILSTLKVFEVPSRKEIGQMEKKIHQLESELMTMHRRALIKKLKSGAEKPKEKKTKPVRPPAEKVKPESVVETKTVEKKVTGKKPLKRMILNKNLKKKK